MRHITLRNFCADDCGFLAAHFRPGMRKSEAMALVDEWGQKRYRGAYFEMFAIVCDHAPVGWISLYDKHGDSTVGIGFEVIESEQRKGYCYQAVQLAFAYAKSLGYTAVISQVRKNNAASLRLHEKCGFAVTGECVTSRGNEAVWLRKEI